MNTTLKKKDDGFTIIEVVLVLAIAGLIFLIVFLALPQLQASRRDTQRKNDAGRLVAAVENYAGNNSGTYPTNTQLNAANGAGWVSGNISGDFKDPDTGSVYVFKSSAIADGDSPGTINYTLGALCTGSPNARSVRVQMRLENGTYC